MAAELAYPADVPDPSATELSPPALALGPTATAVLPAASDPTPSAVLELPVEANNALGSTAAMFPAASDETALIGPVWADTLAAEPMPEKV